MFWIKESANITLVTINKSWCYSKVCTTWVYEQTTDFSSNVSLSLFVGLLQDFREHYFMRAWHVARWKCGKFFRDSLYLIILSNCVWYSRIGDPFKNTQTIISSLSEWSRFGWRSCQTPEQRRIWWLNVFIEFRFSVKNGKFISLSKRCFGSRTWQIWGQSKSSLLYAWTHIQIASS